MESEPFLVAASDRGRIAVSRDAVVRLVGAAAAESYGVVALAGRGWLSRLVPWGIKKGVDVELRDGGLAVEVRVILEHGLKVAEVAEAIRQRVLYELERMIGLPIASLEVRVQGVRAR